MDIIVHYPKNEQDRTILQKRVDEVHVQAILSYINKLNCPHYQKIKLIEEICVQNKSSTSRTQQLNEM